MKNSGTCDIENTLAALEETIENKKMQMQNARAQSLGPSMTSHLFSQFINKAGGSYIPIGGSLGQVQEFAQEFLKKTQQSIREKPWEVLRKVAVTSFAIGLFLSLRRKRSPIGEKE